MKLKSNIREKITALSLSLLMALSYTVMVSRPLVYAGGAINMVPNSNLSQTDSTTGQPLSWHTDSWGSNTPTFSFTPPSQTNQGSLRVDMQGYQSGDAKWWFNPVNITTGDMYQFTDFYTSSTTSNIWARFLDGQNNPTYQWLGSDGAASSTQQGSFNFTAPAGEVSVTIFHVINSNGYLITSGFSMYDITPPPCNVTMSKGIYNSSLEQTCNGDTSTPADWSHAIYGQATASFDYLNSGHTGNHSIDVNVTSAPSGEAGWYFKSVPVAPSQRYQFSFWYDSTIYAYAYAEITLSNGQITYISLMSIPASGSVWSQYQDEFITPVNAQSLTIHVATSAIGQVILDDFSLTPLTNYASNNFTRPIISIDFDDGWQTEYTNGLPAINNLGLKATFYINAGTLNTTSYMTSSQVKTLAKDGEEIASHSYYHDDLVQVPFATAQNEITSNQTFLQSLTGQPIDDFATPYGSYNTPVLNYIMQFYDTQRDTSGQLNYKYNFNPSIIHSVLITKETTVSQINSLIQQSKQNGAWLIFTYHAINSGGDDYTVTKSALQQQLQAIVKSGVAVETTNQAFTEIQPQL